MTGQLGLMTSRSRIAGSAELPTTVVHFGLLSLLGSPTSCFGEAVMTYRVGVIADIVDAARAGECGQ
jgi:hypothetical protein